MEMKFESLVIGGLGCVTNMLEAYMKRLTINKFCNLELLQWTAVLGSNLVDICKLQLADLDNLCYPFCTSIHI